MRQTSKKGIIISFSSIQLSFPHSLTLPLYLSLYLSTPPLPLSLPPPPSPSVQVPSDAGQLWDVSEGRPQVRVWLVRPGEEVLSPSGVRSGREQLDARHHRQQPLRSPQDHQGNDLVIVMITHTYAYTNAHTHAHAL